MFLSQCAREIKSSLSRALYVVACDEALRVSCSGNYEIAEAYLEQCSPEKFDIVQRIRKVVDSFTHTHMFLRDFEVKDLPTPTFSSNQHFSVIS